MSVLSVPVLEAKPWPTLGPAVCQFIEERLVHGPGDLRGEPARLDDEKRGLIYRMYEVFPKGAETAGRRRFKRVALSLRKGSAKTELASWVTICELSADAPVRCIGFDGKGNPIGGPVTDPYIPMVAYTEEQVEELAFGALRVIIELSPSIRQDFDIGLSRVMRRGGDGKAEPLSAAPSSRDGARTTFQVFDETHRMIRPKLKQAHRTMLANTPKRKIADAWTLEISTAPAPGEGSVAEDTMTYARQIEQGTIQDPKLFFFHRQASDRHDLSNVRSIRAAVREASGPVAQWSDIDAIVEQWQDPTADKAYLERVWLNRLVQSSERAFDAVRWRALEKAGHVVPRKALVALGFDGARFHDSTALVATEIPTGYQFPIGVWERPPTLEKDRPWEVPKLEVDAAVAAAFEQYTVWRLYADPPFWEETVAQWSGIYGEERVIEWWTNRIRQMAYAVRGFVHAIAEASVSHGGDARVSRHISNAHKRSTRLVDDDDKPLCLIQKEQKGSPFKIDAASASVLSWQARCDAIAAGEGQLKPSVYESRGVILV